MKSTNSPAEWANLVPENIRYGVTITPPQGKPVTGNYMAEQIETGDYISLVDNNVRFNTNTNNPINIDSIKKGIALSQYQKSTQNPYLNQEVIKINKDFTNTIPQGNFQIPPRPKKTVQSDFSSPYIQRKNNKINYTPKTNEKSSSTKFLESVTKIYEQSGRKDLATGLKNSISKAKQSI